MTKHMSCGQLQFRFATSENVKAILHEVRNRMPQYLKNRDGKVFQSEQSMENLLLEVIRDVARDINPQIKVDRKPGLALSKAPAYMM